MQPVEYTRSFLTRFGGGVNLKTGQSVRVYAAGERLVFECEEWKFSFVPVDVGVETRRPASTKETEPKNEEKEDDDASVRVPVRELSASGKSKSRD